MLKEALEFLLFSQVVILRDDGERIANIPVVYILTIILVIIGAIYIYLTRRGPTYVPMLWRT